VPRFRVLNIITRLEQGGAPLALLETVKRIDRSCFDITVVAGETEDKDRDLDLSATDFDLPVTFIPALRRSVHPIRDVHALYELVRLIGAGEFDLVHTHTSKAGLLGRIAASICGVPAIVHSSHGTILQGYFSPAVTSVFAALESFAATVSDRIICLTRDEIGQYTDAGIGREEQYSSIFNGIDLEAFKQRRGDRLALREGLGVAPDDTLCVTVGRLVPVKGQSDLLEGFAAARNQDGRLRLLLIGDGELRPSLTRQSEELGIASSTIFAGWRDDVSELLDACDMFVLTSLNEGLGLVLIEAMAKRLPVIATAVGGVPEVVDGDLTGTLVPSGDSTAIANAILHLGASPRLRESMGNRGYDRAHALFSIDETVKNTENVYHDLLARPR
jgi:glycosyltransferase involved in cell wall biosynthesis